MPSKHLYVFPGQGSQSIGMLSDFEHHSLLRQTFDEASQVLHEDLWRLVCQGPKDLLDLTTNTQPAMLAAGIAMYRIWRAETELSPTLLAGHSLGEYTALVAAGAMAFSDAIRLVRLRAQAMLTAVPPGVGGMAALIGLDRAAVVDICTQASSPDAVVEAVNFNAPTQIAIAGHLAALDKAIMLAKVYGGIGIKLPVSGPFHSTLMHEAAERLSCYLADLEMHPPRIPVIHNCTARPMVAAEDVRHSLATHVCSPVFWTDSIRYGIDAGMTAVIELGPGKVLTGLSKQICSEVECLSVNDGKSLLLAKEKVLDGVRQAA